ncbi:hypothetical protein [Pseudoclavibacter sp. 8L]|uniref:hypothetical protein n=1 Tax=Pseudoclavibacter sp. 8L TaxID=2653162 RepID=UPI0012F39AC8|nr:hypothetical protein [Pseudoclavibacter sp. 8L]VXB34807.1 hypothetical protein PSCLAVI8L_130533 [Pseudoclavibacter sp. 8L]
MADRDALVKAEALDDAADLLGDTQLDTMWEALAWLRGQAHSLRATGELADDVEPRPASDAAIAAAARAMYDENRSPYLNADQHDAGYTDVVEAGYTELVLAGFAAAERVRHVQD